MSSLHDDLLREISESLDGHHYQKLRCVCTRWRNILKERFPQLILMKFADKEDTVQELTFFDIIYKEFRQCNTFVDRAVRGSHFLGSSHGWLFMGVVKDAKLNISLIDPFASNDIISLPPLPHDGCTGAKVVISDSPKSHQCVVIYCPRFNNKFSSSLKCIKLVAEKQWSTLRIDSEPTGIISSEGHVFVCVNNGLFQVDIDRKKLLAGELSLPGPFAAISAKKNLSYVQDIAGVLYVLVNGSKERKKHQYCFCSVTPLILGSTSCQNYVPPIELMTDSCLMLSDDHKTDRLKRQWVHVQSYDASGLIAMLSNYWVPKEYVPVGWISKNTL